MRKIFLANLVLVFLFSCQPEFPPPSTWNAEGSLSDSSGNCYNSLVEGAYMEGNVLNISQFIDVFASFTTTGSYEVKTDTLNGYYFIGSGTVSTTGLKAIRLTGYGQPIVAGSDTFHMRLNNSVCEAIVEVLWIIDRNYL